MPKTFKFFKWTGKKAVAFCVLSVVLAVAVVGTTLAYVIDKTQSITNVFPPPNIDIEINTTGDTIVNTGDIPVYVRAAVVVTWVNTTDGTTLSTMPVEGTDYTITFNTANDWVKGSDSFRYYKSALAANGNAGDTAADLITDITVTASNAPEGYRLNVQVLSSAIQATPITAVVSSWQAVTGVTNGKLVVQEDSN